MAGPSTTYENHCCSAYSVLSDWSPYHHAVEDVCQIHLIKKVGSVPMQVACPRGAESQCGYYAL